MSATPAEVSLAVLQMAEAGRFAEICELYAPQLRPLVTAEALRVAWAAELDRCGPVSAAGVPLSEPAGSGVTVVRVPITRQRGRAHRAVAATGLCGPRQLC